jgi:protein N-terminal methyltransferase
MLGGIKVNDVDLSTSRSFLSKYFSPIQKRKRRNDSNMTLRVADCGSGIGRISFGLLHSFFQKIDLIEPCQQFIDTAKQNALKMGIRERCTFIVEPLQSVQLEANHYDVIWIQWVL